MRKPLPTRERVSELLSFDPETGVFLWLQRRGQISAGAIAGRKSLGYVRIRIDYADYPAHRLAWLVHYGTDARGQIDHINGNGEDNRIVNLRECTEAENKQNRRSCAKSGLLGAHWQSAYQTWRSVITVNGVRHQLGCFDTAEKAHAAYCAAKAELHKFQPIARNK